MIHYATSFLAPIPPRLTRALPVHGRAALAEALASTERLARLADDLLTLARLGATAAPRAVELVDLSEVLHELADASAERAAQHQIAVTVTAPSGLWVSGNASDLYRLFNNLIDNALRHGTNGTPGEIALSARREAERIHVSIADSGPGIASQDLARIFDRFSRGQTGSADATGVGLGLTIAQEINPHPWRPDRGREPRRRRLRGHREPPGYRLRNNYFLTVVGLFAVLFAGFVSPP